jgi:hypothetical protein
MTFQEDVTILKNHIDAISSIGELRTYLLEKKLKLVVTLLSTGFTCMDWNITQRQVSGVLELGVQMRLSKLVDDEVLLETRFYESVRLNQIDPIDQRDLFETLKQAIKTCIKKVC